MSTTAVSFRPDYSRLAWWFDWSDLRSVRSDADQRDYSKCALLSVFVWRCRIRGRRRRWQMTCNDCDALSPRRSADVRHSSASGAVLFWTLSQDSVIRRAWMKRNERDGARAPSITGQQRPRTARPPRRCSSAARCLLPSAMNQISLTLWFVSNMFHHVL